MEEKKNKIMTLLGIVAILIIVIGLTYAFFAPQAGGTTSTNATVTSNTTDLLTFSINRDISFTVTQADFQENGTNQSGDATATATLTPNNKTGAATMNYYLYLNIESNPTVYSEANTNEDPELMLQVFDGNNQLVTLTGLGTQKTIKRVTGYDITGVSGLKTILDNHAISATNNTATIENWRIVISLINLDVNQNDNTGKTISAEIIIREDELKLPLTGKIYSKSNRIYAYDYNINSNHTEWCVAQIENDTIFDNSCFNTQTDCNSAIQNSQGIYCKQTTFGYTASDYTTNLAEIKKIGTISYYDSSKNYYDSLSSCKDNLADGDDCFASGFSMPFYLAIDLVENEVVSSSVCFHHLGNDACFNNDTWVENDSTGSLTKTKVENIIDEVIEDYSCSISNGNVTCQIGDGRRNNYITCLFNPNGSVNCHNDAAYCSLLEDGKSKCGSGALIDLSQKTIITRSDRDYYSPNVEDYLFNLNFEILVEENGNDIESYVAKDEANHMIFLVRRPNSNFDTCIILNGRLTCIDELRSGTPGASNPEATVAMNKSKLESRYGYEIHGDYDADGFSFIVPFEDLSTTEETACYLIYFSFDGKNSSISYMGTVTPTWHYYNYWYFCGLDNDRAFCWYD